MNNILLYSRSKKNEAIAEQTASLLVEQLQHLGLHVEITQALNLPRLILNSYQTVHFIIENLPLNINESFHFAVCKALGKTTLLSVLNSERKPNRDFLDFVRPDAFSVSQTNHLKLYRNIVGNKFIFSAFPKTESPAKKSTFKSQGFLVPLQLKIDEVLTVKTTEDVYFDGRQPNFVKNGMSGSVQIKSAVTFIWFYLTAKSINFSKKNL
jgi:hypothetical protein